MGYVCSGAGRAAGDPARRSHLGFGRDGEGVIKQRDEGFFCIFNTRKSRPSANTELLGAGANTICPLQGWLPSGTPRQGLGRGCWTPTIKNTGPSLFCSGSCLGDDELSPHLGYLGVGKGSLGEGGCGENSVGWGGRIW